MKTKADGKFSKRAALSKGQNCLSCSKFSKCSKPKKSGGYVCEKWRKIKVQNDFSLTDMFGGDEFHTADDYNDFVKVEHEQDFNNMEINLVKMMDRIFESDNPYPRDLKVDDGDLPEFQNIYQYFFDPQYGMAKNMQPFSRQLWIGVKLFGDYCPVCSDPKFMKDIENCPIDMRAIDFPDKVMLLNNGKCPKCKGTKLEFVKKGYMNYYRDLVACLGQRSGKSVTFSMFSGYHHHKFLKMGKPAELLTGLPNVTLTATYTATDFKTAMETLWQPFVDIIDESPWFKAYHNLLDDYGKRYGEELYRFKESFLHYKHKKLFTSAASPNKRTLRGRTRFEYAIDELGWFDSSADSKDKVRISADEIYGALDRSMKTVMSASKRLFLQGYNSITPGMSFNISSPAAYDDKIMSMCRTHVDSRVVLAVHLPTWKFNPKEPKANFKKEYMEDPVKAERDFGANPPMASSPFFENTQAIVPAFSEKSNCVEYEYQHKKIEGKALVYRFATVSVKPKADIHPSVIAIDAGYSNNSFALVVGHRQEKDVVFSTLMEIAPDKGKNVLNYNAIFKLVVIPLVQKLNVAFICADRWNSLFLLHKLEEEEGIKQAQYSVKYADFNLYKSYLEGGRIKFPRLEMAPDKILRVPASEYLEQFKYKPSAHLFSQIFTVEDKLKTVDKGKNRTDDLFRASVLASRFLLSDEWVNENLNISKRRNGELGIASLANGGAASNVLATSSGKGIIAS